MNMSLCSSLLLTNQGITLIVDKNTASYNVFTETNHQSANSFSGREQIQNIRKGLKKFKENVYYEDYGGISELHAPK